MRKNKVMLVVRDGWGFTDKVEGNAIFNAKTPFNDYLEKQTSTVDLVCHGEEVGLPEGFQGSSEVGHLNMGAGRIVEQEVTRIFQAMKNRSLFNSPAFKRIQDKLKQPNASLHFIGLLQDEGVHSHQEHLFEMIRYIKSEFPMLRIWVHPFSDGRDTPPRSFLKFYENLTAVLAEFKDVKVGTICGRYYGMDRSKNWDLIQISYNALVSAKGANCSNIPAAVKEAYENQKTPDNVEMFDEYLKPIINSGYPGMKPGDVVINFNYRQDRAIQISKAFLDPDCSVYSSLSSNVEYFGLTQYYDSFENYIVPPMKDGASMDNLLGQVISEVGFRQLRIAETQKFRHVTSFFNGKQTQPYPGEDQVEIPSEFDPSSFATHPEMNSEDITQELLKRLESGYEFVLVNYANCDMVGHTGDYEAAIKGAEFVDMNVQSVVSRARELGYSVIVTADHGNSEEMIDSFGEPKTSHTVNNVKCHLISDIARFGVSHGILSDLAPLVLKLMDLEIPVEMTSIELAKTLIQ